MPLTHESALRVTLDSLFYKDAVLPRLKRIGIDGLKKYFEWRTTDDENGFLQRVCSFVEAKFGGYSIRQGRPVTPNAICRAENEEPPDVVRTGRWPKKPRARKRRLPAKATRLARKTPGKQALNRARIS